MIFVLTNLPIFQCSAILAPIDVLHQMSTLMRNFLCQGSKSNSKRFHQIKWGAVISPVDQGILAVRDLGLMNKALGAKILWRLVTREKAWRKDALCQKCLYMRCLRILDKTLNSKPSSPIWTCWKSTNFVIQEHLSCAPGNRKHIKIWTNQIIGQRELTSKEGLLPLRQWMNAKNLKTLYNISS